MAAPAPLQWQHRPHYLPRGTHRKAVSLPAFVRSFGRQYSARVHNLSAGGAMIETAAPLRPGCEITLCCGSIEARATVVWKKIAHVGMRFHTPIGEADVDRQLCRSDAAAERRRSLGLALKRD